MARRYIFITSGTSITLPSDWNPANNAVHCIGAGAKRRDPNTALTTTMTTGFINIPAAAGPPTGVPVATAGVPLYWDNTNFVLYVYTGSAWKKSATFT